MLFAEEFQTLIEVKKSVITKAVANGVAKSSTLQMQTQRTDAKIEEAILHVQHLAMTFDQILKAEAEAVAAVAPADSETETIERKPLVFSVEGGLANG